MNVIVYVIGVHVERERERVIKIACAFAWKLSLLCLQAKR